MTLRLKSSAGNPDFFKAVEAEQGMAQSYILPRLQDWIKETFEAASIDGANAWQKIKVYHDSSIETDDDDSGADGNWKYFQR